MEHRIVWLIEGDWFETDMVQVLTTAAIQRSLCLIQIRHLQATRMTIWG